MIELCQPPKPDHRQPRLVCPPGTTDTHVHVYGPNDRYPPAPTRMFDVPDAFPGTLRKLLDTLGVQRAVLVQPSGYGVDNQRHLDAVAELGIPARMVAAVRADVAEAELDRLHEGGVRGIRYTVGHAKGVPLSEIPLMAGRIAHRGWHVQLHVLEDGGQQPLDTLFKTLVDLPCDLVVDHVGSVHPADGVGQAGFQALLRLVRGGRCWVKLSSSYRMSALPPPYADMLPFVQALLAERPDRLLWATDWPHVFFKGEMPDTTDLLDCMLDWVPDEAQRHRIFVENPAALYGF